MNIGIDFDRVLFDTDRFKKHLFDEIDDFDRTYGQAKENIYSPEKHAEILGIKPRKIYSVLEDAENFVYTDIKMLETLPENIKVVIVSRGDKRFQNIKIEKSRAIEYVDGFFIVHEKPKDTVNIDFLIDDTKKELEDVDIPGFLFDRNKHSMKDVINQVESFRKRKF